jgi:hypothetical protein
VNVLLAHADRSRIVGGPRLNIGQPTVLVDGFVRGTWKIARHSGAATLTITPFEQFSKKDAMALEREGKQLLAFVSPNAKTHFEIIPRAAQPLDRPASRAAPE